MAKNELATVSQMVTADSGPQLTDQEQKAVISAIEARYKDGFDLPKELDAATALLSTYRKLKQLKVD